MKKKIIKIIIPILILALLGGVYFLLTKVEGPATEDDIGDNLISEYTSLLSISSDTITEYTLITPEYTYTLVKNGEDWNVKGKEFIKLDSVAVSNMISAVSVINADDVFDNPEELSVYGLDNPTSGEVKIVVDGTEYDIKIGNAAPTQDKYYIQFNNDGKVYTLYNTTAKAIVQHIDNIRLKNLHNITEESLMQENSFVSLTITKPNETINIRRKTAEEIEKDIAANAFVMDSPYHKNINTDTFEQYVFEKIPGIKIQSYIEDGPSDLAKYGLDNSQKTVLKFQTVNETLELEIGKEEDGIYYAKLPNENSVFALSPNNLAVLKLDTFKLLDPNIYIAYISDVESVEFKAGSDTVVFRIEDLGDNKFNYYANDSQVEEDKFKAIYQEIIALSFTAPSSNSVSGTADYEYTFNFRDGRADNVKFVSESDRNYVAVVNGNAEFALDKGQVKTLIDKILEFK